MIATYTTRTPLAVMLPLLGTGVAFLSLLSVGFAISGTVVMTMV